jgi:hypothetical protein
MPPTTQEDFGATPAQQEDFNAACQEAEGVVSPQNPQAADGSAWLTPAPGAAPTEATARTLATLAATAAAGAAWLTPAASAAPTEATAPTPATKGSRSHRGGPPQQRPSARDSRKSRSRSRNHRGGPQSGTQSPPVQPRQRTSHASHASHAMVHYTATPAPTAALAGPTAAASGAGETAEQDCPVCLEPLRLPGAEPRWVCAGCLAMIHMRCRSFGYCICRTNSAGWL